jgi:hypothetical protein
MQGLTCYWQTEGMCLHTKKACKDKCKNHEVIDLMIIETL